MIIQKLLIVGDSISSHRPSIEKLGWTGSWGMAASSEANDYVHRFLSRLTAAQGSIAPQLMIAGGGGGKLADKLTQLQELTAFAADLAVVQLGENDNEDVTYRGFEEPYERIVRGILAGNPRSRVYCFSVWAPPSGSPGKDQMIRAVCKRTGATFVNLDRVIADPQSQAASEKRFWHSGVNWHPGDQGMQGYAEALWNAFIGHSSEGSGLSRRHARSTLVLAMHRWSSSPHSIELPAEQLRGRNLLIRSKSVSESTSEQESPAKLHFEVEMEDAEAQITIVDGQIAPHSKGQNSARWTCPMPDNLIRARLLFQDSTQTSHTTGTFIIAASR